MGLEIREARIDDCYDLGYVHVQTWKAAYKGTLYTYPNGDEIYFIGIDFVCRDFSGELLQGTDETLELKWFEMSDLPHDINPPDRKPLQAFVDYINHKK